MQSEPQIEQFIGLSAARHAVPICGLLAIFSVLTPRSESFVTYWLISVALTCAVGCFVAGVVSLYSKRRTLAGFAKNARNTSWAVVIVLLLSLFDFANPQWGSLITRPQNSTTTPTSDSSVDKYPINPSGAALLLQARNEHTELIGLSDENAIRAIHQALYPDLPLARVAAKFGIRLER